MANKPIVLVRLNPVVSKAIVSVQNRCCSKQVECWVILGGFWLLELFEWLGQFVELCDFHQATFLKRGEVELGYFGDAFDVLNCSNAWRCLVSIFVLRGGCAELFLGCFQLRELIECLGRLFQFAIFVKVPFWNAGGGLWGLCGVVRRVVRDNF